MSPNEFRKNKPVIDAWLDGKIIQYRRKDTDALWTSCAPNDNIGWFTDYEYRVKPAPTFDSLQPGEVFTYMGLEYVKIAKSNASPWNALRTVATKWAPAYSLVIFFGNDDFEVEEV